MKRIQDYQSTTNVMHDGNLMYFVTSNTKLYTYEEILKILGPRHKAKDEAGGVIAFAKNNLLDDQMKRLKKEVI